MSEEKNIVLDASMKSFRREVAARLSVVEKSLNLLSNKGSLYAWEHRRMRNLYREVLALVDEHYERAKEDRKQPLPPVDDRGIEIHF